MSADRDVSESGKSATKSFELEDLEDQDLAVLRARVETEMRRRKMAFSVGDVGERLVIEHFKTTPNLPKLQRAPAGTKNVDALSREGDRYSIKTAWSAKKTGTIYPDPQDPSKPLFEFLLIVHLDENLALKSIHRASWSQFTELRSWDRRMNAWYVACAAKTLRRVEQIYPPLEEGAERQM